MRIIFIFLICLVQYVHANNKEVLLLHSYNKGLRWSDGISQGVLSVFEKHPDLEVTTEYMDSKKIASNEYFNSLLNLYRQKFKQRRYAAIIVADNYAYEFALHYRQELFPQTPIVFCGVENFHSDFIAQNNATKWTTGVVEYKEISGNLKLIKKLIPELKTLYIISDNAYSSQQIKKQILEEAKAFESQFHIIYDNQIDLETLPNTIAQLPKSSAILYTSLYRDKYDRYIPYAEIRRFFKESLLPVFALNSMHLGQGIVGGVLISPQEQGEMAALKTLEIISGRVPSDIPISTPKAKAMFDYKKLKHYQIPSSNLPPSAILINQPLDFIDEHRDLVNNVFTVSPLLFSLIIILLHTLYKKSLLETKLLTQSELDNVLLNNIQSAIFWRNHDGILLGCNRALCFLLHKEKEEIIGQHIEKILPSFCDLKLDDGQNFVSDLEIPFKDINGHHRDLMIRRKSFEEDKKGHQGIVVIITDITHRKKRENERKRNEQFVIQRSKQSEVGEMLTSIAHQWKTPLVEISAIAQELLYTRRKRDISEADTKVFVDDVMSQISYMTKTIDDFRKFIKPSTKQVGFDVNMALEEILHVMNHTITYNYITVDLSLDKETPHQAFGYPNEFKQTVLNILNNAKDAILKAREQGKKAGKIILKVTVEKPRIGIEISDDGLGFSDNILSQAFEPFFTTKEEGDGFGLYMAKLIIEDKMDGRILASNWENGGKITIYIKNIAHSHGTIIP